MIHLPTAVGGQVEHVVQPGAVVERGTLLARVHPAEGPLEEICAPLDGIVEVQRLKRKHAPRYARIVGIRRVILASCDGQVRWIATLGPVGMTTLVALVGHEKAVRPHRAGASGFVGTRYVRPGQQVKKGQPLIEIRGEELV